MSLDTYAHSGLQLKNIEEPSSIAEENNTPFGDTAPAEDVATPTPPFESTGFYANLGVSEQEEPPVEKEPEEPSKVAPSPFTRINVKRESEDGEAKAEIISYLGDSQSLLETAAKTERELGLTLPLSAFGLRSEVFERMCGDSTSLALAGPTEESDPELYELVRVSGGEFLSCLTSPLCISYLESTIVAAKEALLTTNRYEFKMVGYRMMPRDAGDRPRFVRTLRLNSYEMSALVEALDGVCDGVEHEVSTNEHGEPCILFTIK